MQLTIKRAGLASVLFLCLSPFVAAEPWQNITQPIGTLLVNPPESALSVNQYLIYVESAVMWSRTASAAEAHVSDST